MKYLLLIFLVACSPSPYSKHKQGYSMPPEMEGCKVYNISDGSEDLFVVLCPNATTSTSWSENCGKNCYKTTHVNLVHK